MSYSCFAKYYDELTENVDYSSWADFLLGICKKHDHVPGIVLDLACGTGSLVIELNKRGVDAFGADSSSEMLTEAMSKAVDNDLHILFICQKMQNLDLYSLVDTVFCTLDSISHITNEKDLLSVFERVYDNLSESGLFVFDVNTVYKHREILGDNCYIYDMENVFCAWQNNYESENNSVMITLDFFEKKGDHYLRSSEQFFERAYTRDEMSGLLSEAGFCIESVYGELSFTAPSETEQREFYVVRKIKNEK